MGASFFLAKVPEKRAPMGGAYGEWGGVNDCGLMVEGLATAGGL